MRRWEWIQYQKFNNPDTSWTSLTLTTFILGLQLILWLGGNVGTPIWAVSPSCCNNNNTHLMFQDITNTQISQRGPGQKGGEKIAVRTRIATITSPPPSRHVSVSLPLMSPIWSSPLQGITWTRSQTTSVVLLDNPSPWPCSSHPSSCSSTSRTFLVCVGCHLPPHQSQSPGRRRPETESHLTAEQSDCLIGLIQNCAKITCSFLKGKLTRLYN